MKHFAGFVFASLVFACIPQAFSQQLLTFSEPCKASTTQRTIVVCTPVSGVTISLEFLLRAKINDPLPVAWSLFIDGKTDLADMGTGTDVIRAIGFVPFPFFGWHQVTIIALDSIGSFQRSIWVRTVPEFICPQPTTTNTVTICTPTNTPTPREAVTNPVHIAAVANYPNPKAMLIYIDGVKAARSSRENSGDGLTISQYILLKPGTHRITVQARNLTSAVASKTITVQVIQ
jgi:hypothetical protein